MKKRIKWIAVVCCVAIFITGTVIAFASQENNFEVPVDFPCDSHSFVIADFENNTLTLQCEYCGETSDVEFKDLAGKKDGDSGYLALADVNEDGIINGRDLVYLKTAAY